MKQTSYNEMDYNFIISCLDQCQDDEVQYINELHLIIVGSIVIVVNYMRNSISEYVYILTA